MAVILKKSFKYNTPTIKTINKKLNKQVLIQLNGLEMWYKLIKPVTPVKRTASAFNSDSPKLKYLWNNEVMPYQKRN